MKKIKYVFSIAIIFIAFLSKTKVFAQEVMMPMNENSKIAYSGVVEIKDKDQQRLYADAKEYILNNYTIKEFPTIIDEPNERIYFQGAFKTRLRKRIFPIFWHSTLYDLIYTYRLYFKDGKYKYQITDMYLTRKTDTRINGYYWGTGFIGGSIKEGQVIKKDLEDMYKVRRYRTKWAKLFLIIDTEITKEIVRLADYMKNENSNKKW